MGRHVKPIDRPLCEVLKELSARSHGLSLSPYCEGNQHLHRSFAHAGLVSVARQRRLLPEPATVRDVTAHAVEGGVYE